MKLPEEHEVEKENSERWVLTYADMITLLMVFFIVMYSMSAIDSKKYSSIAEQLNVMLGGGSVSVISTGAVPSKNYLAEDENADSYSHQNPDETESQSVSSINQPVENTQAGNYDKMTLENVEKNINEFIEQQNLTSKVTVYKDARGTVISFNEALLFVKGSADIHKFRKIVVDKVSEIISQTDNYIRVEGFTDDLPIHTSKFDSNWELASQRAINVAKALIDQGIDPSRVSCLSYGQYRPSYLNDSEEGRAKNRRVDIVLIYKNLDVSEPGFNN